MERSAEFLRGAVSALEAQSRVGPVTMLDHYRSLLAAAESRLAEVERERGQLLALVDAARDGMRQLGEDLVASRAEVERLRGVSSMPPDYVKNVIRASRGDRKKMREATVRAEAAESLVAGLRGALEEARKDNEELDGTDAAHPAWWRGNDAGVSQVCAKINAILDGADVFGTAAEPWESTRRRVAEARKNSERLDKVRRVLAAYQGSALGCNPQILFAAVSDAARGTK